ISIASLPLASIYLSRYVTAPINTLHEGAEIIAQGKLSHRIKIKTGDEIEALADGFNKMAASLEDAKKELDRRVLELFTLYNISKVLNTTFETEQLLIKLVNDISKNLDIQRVMIMLLDERKQELYAASFTDFQKEGLNELRRKVGEGFYGLVAQTGMSRLIKDVDTELNLPKEDILSPDIQSIVAVPFGRREKVLGLLCAFKDRPKMFEWHDLELLGTVAEHVAVALENARLYHETKLQAITDGLTGLYNHRFFREHLKVELERTDRYNHTLSLIILDIDHFKHYNDTHGHPQGDELLRGLAELLRKSVRESDIPCRYGGEEFALILPETAKDAALALGERIRKAISEHPFPFREAQPMGTVSVSVGVAVSPAD
ncbi:MAG: diguanylate cyclase, partial [Deltaproteobacteria bacterium]